MTKLLRAGRRVLVTRPAHQASKLSDGLRAIGAIPVEVPVLEIVPPASFEALDTALRQIDIYDWIFFTSANTVQAITVRGAEIGVAVARAAAAKVAAVGAATASAANQAGWDVAVVPESYVAESLVAALENQIKGKRVLLARAAVARDVIPEALQGAGANVDVVDAYRNIVPQDAPEQLKLALAGDLAAVTFTSSSSVTHLAEAAKAAGIRFPFPGVPAISIGPITSQTLREMGCEPAEEANPHDIPGLIACVERVLRRFGR